MKNKSQRRREVRAEAHKLFGEKNWQEHWAQNYRICVVVHIRSNGMGGGVSAWVENHGFKGNEKVDWNVFAETVEGTQKLHSDFTKIMNGDFNNLHSGRIK